MNYRQEINIINAETKFAINTNISLLNNVRKKKF